MLKVFISSTSTDLKEHRAAVRDIVLALRFHPIMMEYFPAMDADAVQACMDAVDEADIYIGIFAYRYGYIPQDGNISITEMEFNRATKNGMARLCFLVDENAIWHGEMEAEPGRSRLQHFKNRLNTALVRATFDTPDSLALEVSKALQAYRPQRVRINRRWRVFGFPLLLMVAALIAVWLRANTPPPEVSLAYAFLVDTSSAMNEVLPSSGLTRYQMAQKAIERVAGVANFDVSDTWRSIRVAGGGECTQTQRISAGMQSNVPVSAFMEPLYRIPPYGGNAYISGVKSTLEDMRQPEPEASDVQLVFLFLGSLDPQPCGDQDRFFQELQGFKLSGITGSLCTFALGVDVPGFQRLQEQASDLGLDCFRNFQDEDEMGQFAVGVIQSEIRRAQGMIEEGITPIAPPTRIVLGNDLTPLPSQFAVTQFIPPTVTTTPTPTPPTPIGEVNQAIEARGGPGLQYEIVATIPPNEPFTVIGVSEDGSWAQVRLADDSTGWLSLGGQGVGILDVNSDVVLPTVIVTPRPTATNTPTPTSTATPSATPTSTPTAIIVDSARSMTIRLGPGSQYPVIATLETNERLNILGISEDGGWYLVLLSDGTQGWLVSSQALVNAFGDLANVPIAPAPTNTPDVIRQTQVAGLVSCPGTQPSQLLPGDRGQISIADLSAQRLREGSGTDSRQIANLSPGEQFTVLDGPVCADGYAWYQIRTDEGIEGWTVEGDDRRYWLEYVASVCNFNAVCEAGENDLTCPADCASASSE